MDPVNILIQGTIVVIQSVICIVYGCRMSCKVDELETRLSRVTKQASLRLIRLEKLQYTPPATECIAPVQLAPLPSAPLYTYSSSKSYEPYNI